MKPLRLSLLLAVSLAFSSFSSSYAQVIQVSTSEELANLLKQDKEIGTIVLTGKFYCIDNLNVKAGGTIIAAHNTKPIIAGKCVRIDKPDDAESGSKYWTKKLSTFERGDYFILDERMDAIPISGVESGVRNIEYYEREIKKISEKERKIAIPIKGTLAYLRNRDRTFLKYCSIKLSCWFVCMDVTDLYSDSDYLYGIVDSDYNYVKLGKHGYMFSYMTIFNYPCEDGSAFVDSHNVVHIPNKYKNVYISLTSTILNLQGKRPLNVNGVTFSAANCPIKMGNNSLNKGFYNCSFVHCGTGVEFKNYVDNAEGNLVIDGCEFRNLYSNYAIRVLPVKNVLIQDNVFSHTGILNKGGSVISINADNFKVEGNVIEDFSYHGIGTGLEENYNYKRISGVIRNNTVDNEDRFGDASTQLYDGGGIYIYAHVDSILVENNIIRNFGFAKGLRFGLYLDGGAYNVTARNNLVYNMFPGQQAVHARYVISSPKRSRNNVFENNVIVGDCRFGGNVENTDMPTVVCNNFISGETTFENDNVDFTTNKEVNSIVSGETVLIDKRAGLRKCRFTKNIRRLLKTSKRIEKN